MHKNDHMPERALKMLEIHVYACFLIENQTLWDWNLFPLSLITV